MPEQKPGRSRQNYATPDEFVEAVLDWFGLEKFDYDLACDENNRKADMYCTEESDSLSADWTQLHGHLYLNPPFGDIGPWAAKCATSTGYDCQDDRHIYLLTPASVGSNWYRDSIHGQAAVYFLNGRLCFDGKNPFPKDCMLSCYGPRFMPGCHVWDWKNRVVMP